MSKKKVSPTYCPAIPAVMDDFLSFNMLQLENLFLNLILPSTVIYLGCSGVKSETR